MLLEAMLLLSRVFVPAVNAQSDGNKVKQIYPYTYVADNKVPDKKKFLDKIEPVIDRKHNVSSSTGQVTSQDFDTRISIFRNKIQAQDRYMRLYFPMR